MTQVAVLEGRSLIEHYVSRPADDVSQIHGNIYLGKVQNVLPGMEAAFVDIATPKNAVLYRGDVQYDAEDIEERGNNAPHRGHPEAPQLIVCQVTKNPIGAKGARLTQEVSLPGALRGADPELEDLRHLQAPPRRRAQAAAASSTA
jgi:ribonuclease E